MKNEDLHAIEETNGQNSQQRNRQTHVGSMHQSVVTNSFIVTEYLGIDALIISYHDSACTSLSILNCVMVWGYLNTVLQQNAQQIPHSIQLVCSASWSKPKMPEAFQVYY